MGCRADPLGGMGRLGCWAVGPGILGCWADPLKDVWSCYLGSRADPLGGQDRAEQTHWRGCISPRLRAALLLSHPSQALEFVRFAKVFPLKELGFVPEPGRYLVAVGWVEVVAGLLLAFGPQLLQEISNFILSVVMIGESQWAPTAHRGVLGHPWLETPIPMLCSLPRCHLHAAGAAGATGHVCPGHRVPRPPPAAQHPRVPGCSPAQVRVTTGGKDRWLGWWEAMPLWYFQGQHRILQGNLLKRHCVSCPASASDSGCAGCPHTAELGWCCGVVAVAPL